jgi:hypothetical protein
VRCRKRKIDDHRNGVSAGSRLEHPSELIDVLVPSVGEGVVEGGREGVGEGGREGVGEGGREGVGDGFGEGVGEGAGEGDGEGANEPLELDGHHNEDGDRVVVELPVRTFGTSITQHWDTPVAC